MKQATRRLPFAKQEEDTGMIDKMLEESVIEESSSPWYSPFIPVCVGLINNQRINYLVSFEPDAFLLIKRCRNFGKSFDEIYCNILSLADDILNKNSSENSSLVNPNTVEEQQKSIPRLPKLELPSFSVIVNVFTKDGNKHKLRFLLDSCSQTHFLTIGCARRLKLDITKCHSLVNGIGHSNSSVYGKSHLVFSSRFDSNIKYPIEVLLVDKITDQLPSCRVYSDSLSHFRNLPLADDTFDRPGKIDGVIGADLFPLLLGKNKIKGSMGSPIGIGTSLGYVVMGSVPTFSNSEIINSFCTTLEPSLEKLTEGHKKPEGLYMFVYLSSDKGLAFRTGI
ncbi:hypothetical protein NQ318_017255 [Aromia moschata]|uniref:Peptidase aspartic putative domain-containing protein n=1 Tax=Aromia moschata TaxID=1265417 RepID=A0AAV8YM77_9CUCU|nr:hypothetical protein NQ318_017255 [Aromia moschata]